MQLTNEIARYVINCIRIDVNINNKNDKIICFYEFFLSNYDTVRTVWYFFFILLSCIAE